MQPVQSPPVAPPSVPVAAPKKTPIDISALKLKMSASVRATLAAAGVLGQCPRPIEAADEDALLKLKPMKTIVPSVKKVVAPVATTAPPPKVRRVESSSSSSSDSSSSSSDDDSSSDDSSGSDSSSYSSDDRSSSSAESVVSGEATLFHIAQSQGLVNKEVLAQEEEEVPTLVPPRPPVVRSFPNDIGKALERYRERLNREENIIRIKDDNKAVSLGTSKINYIDPRIICSWAKAQDVPINKIFSATIQKKFPWAMNAENFDF
ncbi:DNA topoisomerase type IB small subunit [Leishmania infantum JPCM5]|uniref:DNA_topoisomerase_type_IB_small_subunit_-_putative n=2 Tax=Leishmania infantum TaxID=5671 RepID=A0A6L0WH81_LEIIN|nr:DNA topoisomerase type IB small subunit [Leishmania infantum JPCM5]CAC9440430.1 DNA_topoisomerase_type_IB_small_subunit_-_putative [Leishmania infantum]CAM65030.1 DNA topoisomerase type IB small subunit [Leishmania infantum JPCM5]SUZ38802.1 DNA_topoisomerase_type_IB_small_subunit_-_putative [Leishmania infantum]|eukprot:XP_001462844.1 DNA topoisomerase type IB small subunit [Leishmania infantum JPCM5]